MPKSRMRCKFFAMRASRSSSNWESSGTRVESGVWKVDIFVCVLVVFVVVVVVVVVVCAAVQY